MQRQIEDHFAKGFSKASRSPCVVPALHSRRRMLYGDCVDRLQLIESLPSSYFPLRLDELLGQLVGFLRLRSGNERKTASKTPDGLFEWFLVPVGLSSVQSTFMQVMMRYFNLFLVPFLSCILMTLIYIQKKEEHLNQVEKS